MTEKLQHAHWPLCRAIVRAWRWHLVLLAAVAVSCVSLTSSPDDPSARLHRFSHGRALHSSTSWNEQVARSAAWHLQKQPPTRRRDCSGLVEAILAHAGASVQGNSRSFFGDARAAGRVSDAPLPGDLVFFDRTYDANRNGRVDDRLTHVAVVVATRNDGTVEMVHRGSGRIQRLTMNLTRPNVHRDAGQLLNDYLRAPGYGRRDGPRLAGQLFRAFARPPRS